MGENVTSKLLSGSDDFRDSRAVEEELGEKRMIRVGECEDQVTEDWHGDSVVDGERNQILTGRGKGIASSQYVFNILWERSSMALRKQAESFRVL